ncbi:MAG: U32 family peptidase [Variibacter sp.]|nr:U32 family peptidase [Variibacter sp.]
MTPDAELTLGPVLFNWAPETWRDFYFRAADESPVSTVYVGEMVCSKRVPLFEPYLAAVLERLRAAGKTVVVTTLAQVMSKPDRRAVEAVCQSDDFIVEANDGSSLARLRGRPHRIGPAINLYNERTLGVLARGGARHVCLPPEMPGSAVAALCAAAKPLGIGVEVQVFGRVGLALSARCYHARAHGRTKDTCQFVCDRDADGMELKTLDGETVLVVNGIQTMSHTYLNLAAEMPALSAFGVTSFRLSPHTVDMVRVADVYDAVLRGRIAAEEADAQLAGMNLGAPFANGFYHHRPGYQWTGARVH